MALAASNPGVKRAMSAIAATPNTEPARPGTVSSESASVGWEDTSATAAASKVQQDTLPPEDSGGMLFLGNGQSQFVTSMHWALLAEEMQDVKDLLTDQSKQQHASYLLDPDATGLDVKSSLVFGSGMFSFNISRFLPESMQDCYRLLEYYFANVDPIMKLLHRPTFTRRYAQYLQRRMPGQCYATGSGTMDDATLRAFEPLAFMVFYAAVNSLQPSETVSDFFTEKEPLLQKYREGLELALERANFLTTSSIEVLQAFVMLLTCGCREDSSGKPYALVGTVIRIATAQGLHKEPTLFSSTSMDAITIELRRRLWHQIVNLDLRTAGSKGQEPSIRIGDFTTWLPRNINDIDLHEGLSSSIGPIDVEGFTDMTLTLLRASAMQCISEVIAKTYHWEPRTLSNQGKDANYDPLPELLEVYEETRSMLQSMDDRHQRIYLRHCDPAFTLQRLSLGLGMMLQWRIWLVFWYRIPRKYRDAEPLFDIRMMVFILCVCVVENIPKFAMDNDVQRFQWNAGSYIMFHPMMHLISELRSSPFQTLERAPLRDRALAALRNIMQVKKLLDVHAWLVMERMIDKLCADPPRASLSVTSGTSLTPSVTTPEILSGPGLDPINYKDPIVAQPYSGTGFATGAATGSVHKAASYEYTDTTLTFDSFGSTTAFGAKNASYISEEFDWSSLDLYLPDYSGNPQTFF